MEKILCFATLGHGVRLMFLDMNR